VVAARTDRDQVEPLHDYHALQRRKKKKKDEGEGRKIEKNIYI